mgnify:CR=1 FL=1
MHSIVDFNQTHSVPLKVHHFDVNKSEIFFTADAETFAEQKALLTAELNDFFFVNSAKDNLRMSSPAVNDKQVYIYDPKESRVVVPRSGDSIDGFIPILRVKFIDF